MSIIQISLDYLPLLLAVAAGLVRFGKLDLFFRLLLLQAAVYLAIDITALVIAYSGSNNWLYNCYVPVETLVLALAAGSRMSPVGRYVLYVLSGFVIVIFMVDIFLLTGFYRFAFHAAIAEGFFFTGVFGVLLYRSFQKKQAGAVGISATGMMLYFACTIPFMGITFYFQERNPELTRQLFQQIIVVLADLRYLLIAVAFVLVNRKQAPLIAT